MAAMDITARTPTEPLATPQKPAEWNVNPSQFDQRLPVVALAIAGLALSLDMTGGTTLLDKTTSDLLIESAFIATATTGLLGGPRRWSRKPWLVAIFGFAVGPLAFMGATWSFVDMAVGGEWASRTMVRSAVAWLAIGPAMDEILASLQFVRSQARKGRSPLRAFLGMRSRPRRRLEIEWRTS